MNKKIFQPLEDRVLIIPIKDKVELTEVSHRKGTILVESSGETSAGIVLPTTVRKETRQGEVISVGPGRYAVETGTFIPTILRKGDIVIIGAESGLPIPVPNEEGGSGEAVLLREGDVLILVSKKSE